MSMHPSSIIKELTEMRDELLKIVREAAANRVVPDTAGDFWVWVHRYERRLDALEGAIEKVRQ